MAKRWRDEIAPNKRSGLLRRRKSAGSGGVETLERDEEATKRRRIAGERPSTKDAEDADEGTTSKLREPAAETDETSVEPAAGAETGTKPATESESQTLAAELAAKPSKRRSIPAPVWATATGIVVGALLTGLVYAGMQAFQAIYNTPAGGGTGAVVLVVVLIVSLVVGRFLLKWRGLPDPNATTLLAILLIVIVTLAALLPIVFSAWMLAVTPVLGGAAYLVAHLLIARFGNQ